MADISVKRGTGIASRGRTALLGNRTPFLGCRAAFKNGYRVSAQARYLRVSVRAEGAIKEGDLVSITSASSLIQHYQPKLSLQLQVDDTISLIYAYLKITDRSAARRNF